MTSTELKCQRLYEALRKSPRHIDDLATGEFHGFEGLGIRFRLEQSAIRRRLTQTVWISDERRRKYIADTLDGTELLSHIHFCDDHTEFLPNEYLYWKELPEGEYESLVGRLYEVFCLHA